MLTQTASFEEIKYVCADYELGLQPKPHRRQCFKSIDNHDRYKEKI